MSPLERKIERLETARKATQRFTEIVLSGRLDAASLSEAMQVFAQRRWAIEIICSPWTRAVQRVSEGSRVADDVRTALAAVRLDTETIFLCREEEERRRAKGFLVGLTDNLFER